MAAAILFSSTVQKVTVEKNMYGILKKRTPSVVKTIKLEAIIHNCIHYKTAQNLRVYLNFIVWNVFKKLIQSLNLESRISEKRRLEALV